MWGRAGLPVATIAKAQVKLFYWNAFLDYRLYEARRDLPADWHLKDRNGDPVLVRNTVPAYDLAQAQVRGWWQDTAAAAVRDGAADGVFADALLQVTATGKRRLLGDAKRTGWIYQRDFAHASVHVDLETQAARIEWKPSYSR